MTTTSRAAGLIRQMMTSKARPLNIIKRDALELGIKIGICDKRFLSRYPDAQYDSLIAMLSRFKKHWDFSRILVDPPQFIKKLDFNLLPDDFLVDRIEGTTLNLIQVKTSYSKYLENRRKHGPPAIFHPGFIIDSAFIKGVVNLGIEVEYFGKLLSSPDLSIEKAMMFLHQALIENPLVPFSEYRIHVKPEAIETVLSEPASSFRMVFKLETVRGLEAVVELIDTKGDLPSRAEERKRIEDALRIYFVMFSGIFERARALERINKPVSIDPINMMETEKNTVSKEEWEDRLFELTKRKSPLRYFGNTISVGSISTPSSSLTNEEQGCIINALNFAVRDRKDMYQHLIRVAELEIVFYNNRPIAFASGNEIYFQNNGSRERLEYLVATMVKERFYGRGLQTVVNGLFLLKRWKLFNPPFVMMRTNSVGPISGFLKYFSGVVFRLLNPHQQRRSAEFSRFMGCACDKDGKVSNAYQNPPHDIERDNEILQNMSKRKKREYEKVKTALDGIGPQDARIFQGKFTAWKAIKVWFYINFVFRYKNWRKEKRDLYA